ncbi:hypothetical protein GXM_04796 [Nostoc sphaeroides CCNUC1]|uniref:Uncharacterized protein n=1 Tax=Nostoc sphaeroides CCNUC1 TaxID=2653204 RepID=A0A5P8W4V1_9NOSO|nr:hypothetical protein GXM_04796 [Nostoc sphaeroides CCNUC1]
MTHLRPNWRCGIDSLIFVKIMAFALLPVFGHNLKQRQYHTK